MRKKLSIYNIKTITLVLACLIITVVSYNIVFNLSSKSAKETTINSLYTLGKKQKDIVATWSEELKYEIKLYSRMEEIQNMDKTKIADTINFIKAYRDMYAGILVIDNNKNIINGFIEDKAHFLESNYIKEAFSGQMSISDTLNVNGRYYIDIANPITDKNDTQIGIICMRIYLTQLNELMKSLKLDDQTECYVVDRNGYFITDSRYIHDAVGKQKIDLNKVKLSVDYSMGSTYKNYNNEDVYGMYFPLDLDSWTLVIEKDIDNSKQAEDSMRLVGQLTALIEALGIALIQGFFKSRFNMDIDTKCLMETINNYKKGQADNREVNEEIDKIIDTIVSKRKNKNQNYKT